MRWLVDRPVVRVRVGSDAGTVTGGTVEVRELGILLGRGTVRDGAVEVTLPRYVIPGRSHSWPSATSAPRTPTFPHHDHPAVTLPR